MTPFVHRAAALATCLALAALPLAARALCTSEGVPQPLGVVERFINADCATCWGNPATPEAAANMLALDWVVPSSRGDDAPLAAVASADAPARLQALGRTVPAEGATVTSLRRGAPLPLRVAQGAAFNDYIGASVELGKGGRGPWSVWLLLVESLPAGTEGSPVARNLVRNTFRPGWDDAPARGKDRTRREETRSMQIHAGAQPDRLRLVALAQDAQGRMRAITQSVCTE